MRLEYKQQLDSDIAGIRRVYKDAKVIERKIQKEEEEYKDQIAELDKAKTE